jgi:hypothetical protein
LAERLAQAGDGTELVGSRMLKVLDSPNCIRFSADPLNVFRSRVPAVKAAAARIWKKATKLKQIAEPENTKTAWLPGRHEWRFRLPPSPGRRRSAADSRTDFLSRTAEE